MVYLGQVWKALFGACLVHSLLHVACGQSSSILCTSQETCGGCMRADPGCSWCVQEDFGRGSGSRCDFLSNLESSGCVLENIIRPKSGFEFFEEANPDSQLSPKTVKLVLRPRSSMTVKVKFRQARLPVDLYYLMDLSNSMLDDKLKVASLGLQLATEMRKLTDNFRLGFGSFVDKTVMPYVSTVPRKMATPCDGCAAPYGYKHHMKLTENAAEFESRVREASISGNLDAPEGSFDALMQAIVCKKEVGWRDDARKLLLLSTDAGFHCAGDGKLGGIVRPNDGQCHLVQRNGELQYSESNEQDYPSLAQIARAIEANNINLVFAVTTDQLSIYEQLSANIKGSIAGRVAEDSSNVVELVKDQYMKITSSVQLQDTAPAEYVQVNYFSSCLGGNLTRTSTCKNLMIGSEVEWDVAVELKSVPPGPGPHRISFRISPVASREEVTVDLSIISACDCEKSFSLAPASASSKCSFNGTYGCGICACLPGTFGRKCECNSDTVPGDDKDAGCRKGNSTEICSGRGMCVCGQCQCFPRQDDEIVSGSLCECDNFSCDKSSGETCGGAARGVCDCGNCICKPGWVGSACECSTSTDSCMAANGKMCNGLGKCVCGRCQCNADPDTGIAEYYGPTCELCPTCPSLCDTIKPCAQCQAFRTGPLGAENMDLCEANCTSFRVEMVDEIEKNLTDKKLCVASDDSDYCTFFFSLHDDPATGGKTVEVQREKVCPEAVRAWPIILGIILAILFLGLLLLFIWKIIDYLYHRREAKNFDMQVQKVQWAESNQNPLFQPATTTYKNPLHEK